jgi:predicted small lipoprotein YifL
MKKLVLMFVAIAAISFASCGNKNQKAAPASDSDTTAVDTAAADTAAADTAAADTAATAE